MIIMLTLCVLLTGCTARTRRNLGHLISGVGSDIVGATDGMSKKYSEDYLVERPSYER
jgi:hypothetical protein